MAWGDPEFADLVAEVHRETVALDDFTKRHGSMAISAVVGEGKRVYFATLDYLRAAWLTKAEANAF
jgi:hypothetical protein